MAKKTTKKSEPKRSTLPLIEIRQREGAKGIMVGGNTELLIDGKPVRNAKSVTFKVSAMGVATATITLIGRFKVSGKIKTNKVKLYK